MRKCIHPMLLFTISAVIVQSSQGDMILEIIFLSQNLALIHTEKNIL